MIWGLPSSLTLILSGGIQEVNFDLRVTRAQFAVFKLLAVCAQNAGQIEAQRFMEINTWK